MSDCNNPHCPNWARVLHSLIKYNIPFLSDPPFCNPGETRREGEISPEADNQSRSGGGGIKDVSVFHEGVRVEGGRGATEEVRHASLNADSACPFLD